MQYITIKYGKMEYPGVYTSEKNTREAHQRKKTIRTGNHKRTGQLMMQELEGNYNVRQKFENIFTRNFLIQGNQR